MFLSNLSSQGFTHRWVNWETSSRFKKTLFHHLISHFKWNKCKACVPYHQTPYVDIWSVMSKCTDYANHKFFLLLKYYTPTRVGAILQSSCPSVRPFVPPFTLSLKMSQLLREEIILFLIHDFGIVTCTVSPLSRFTAHLLPVYCMTWNFSCLP